ncbi:hypothetical protein [Thalassomonas actiniarum]|uniref:Uncharacterized protein n=1 Tax=Thalassomonas actiniarum TaxID=485447 RepID=A0AAF0C1X8_9GAMM|nr:hypothetical protein [Thalassomonas actiniarum]WDD97225.1 hypothetical protein SG35_018000 [Thalassomonas actiniarum]
MKKIVLLITLTTAFVISILPVSLDFSLAFSLNFSLGFSFDKLFDLILQVLQPNEAFQVQGVPAPADYAESGLPLQHIKPENGGNLL